MFFHPRKPRAISEAEWLCEELRRRGVDYTVENGWDSEAVRRHGSRTDLVIALGGDGTILQVARLVAACHVPVLGVNLGRVGFLAEVTPESLRGKIGQLVAGDFWRERRIMLQAERHHAGGIERFVALNEVAVARGSAPRAIHVRTLLDDHTFMTYTADGVLVATATGSTAYSLAAGGPILYPESPAFLLTPVAPHLHIGRSIIVPPDTTVTLSVPGDQPAVMSVDGLEERDLTPHDIVKVSRSTCEAIFARLGPHTYFYTAIAERLR